MFKKRNYRNYAIQKSQAILKHKVQLTTDGHTAYLEAVEDAFGTEIDYAMLIKIYGKGSSEDEKRCSPADIKEIIPKHYATIGKV